MSYLSHSLKQFGIGLEYETVNVLKKKCNHNFHKYQVSTKKKKHSSGGSGRQLTVLLLPTRGETEEEAPLGVSGVDVTVSTSDFCLFHGYDFV